MSLGRRIERLDFDIEGFGIHAEHRPRSTSVQSRVVYQLPHRHVFHRVSINDSHAEHPMLMIPGRCSYRPNMPSTPRRSPLPTPILAQRFASSPNPSTAKTLLPRPCLTRSSLTSTAHHGMTMMRDFCCSSGPGGRNSCMLGQWSSCLASYD